MKVQPLMITARQLLRPRPSSLGFAACPILSAHVRSQGDASCLQLNRLTFYKGPHRVQLRSLIVELLRIKRRLFQFTIISASKLIIDYLLFHLTIMAELAAAASVIGISTPAFQGVKSAYDFIVGMREAPSNVKRIASELKGLQAVLKSIPTQDDAVPIVRTISREMNLEAAIRTCDKACLEFKGKLEQWMPNPDHPPVFECTRVQFHRTTVRTCRNVVRDTKGVIALAEVIAVKSILFSLCT